MIDDPDHQPDHSDKVGVSDEHKSSGSGITVKLSDLMSYWQLLQTRAGIMLTFSGLTVTASGVVALLLPFHLLPHGILQLPVYAAAFAIFRCVAFAIAAIAMTVAVRGQFFLRLSDRDLVNADHVPPTLHKTLVWELKRKQYLLTTSQMEMALALGLLFGYAVFSLLCTGLVFIRNIALTEPRSEFFGHLGFVGQVPLWMFDHTEKVGAVVGISASAMIASTLNILLSLFLWRAARKAFDHATGTFTMFDDLDLAYGDWQRLPDPEKYILAHWRQSRKIDAEP